MASGRRFPSDTGAFADWVTSSSGRADDLSLGFNAGGGGGGVAATAPGSATAAAFWAASSSASGRHALNYGIADMGLVGLRDVFVVAPAAASHHEQMLCAAEHPIIPLLAAAPCLVEDSRSSKPQGGIHLFQPPPPQNPNPNSSGILSIASGTSTCQDCGNQAKKDCPHRRCRTCCKSRGFDCSTHIKSTWVPAARRRERQLASDNAIAGSSTSTSAPKKARFISSQTTTTSHTSTSNTPPRSFDTSSSQQEASFRENLPSHVRAPAIFKCVRVTSVDDGEDEYAYQAIVNIGGHVFKGFLYDQGADDARGDLTGTSPMTGANSNAVPNISELHLGAGRTGGASSSAMLPSDVYGAAAACSAMLGGAAYGNTIN